ncbi:hypothetical protein [uncultured Alistipes sp.]|uniref:hypothetical protein n=1 Tax=uncultured Alistipes sp. TaxID=538949 RepID=UPI002597D4ED|nr:hypothetical protein [uncultured Alistipes sp.]
MSSIRSGSRKASASCPSSIHGASTDRDGQNIRRHGSKVVRSMPCIPMVSATRRDTATYSSGVTSRASGITTRTRHSRVVCLWVE